MDGNQDEYTTSQWFDVQNEHNFSTQYVITRLWIGLLGNVCFLSLCRLNRLVSERTNGKIKSTMLIKIIYQNVYQTITNHLECNKGEYNTHSCIRIDTRSHLNGSKPLKIFEVEATKQHYTIWHPPLYNEYYTLSCHIFLSILSQQFYLIPWKLWIGSKML